MDEEEVKARNVFFALKQLRSLGWRVAVHNDYMLNGRLHTFWLFTREDSHYFVKGESSEDVYALNQVLEKAEKIDKKIKAESAAHFASQ